MLKIEMDKSKDGNGVDCTIEASCIRQDDLVDYLAIAVRRLYDTICNTNPAAGKLFRLQFLAAMADKDFWNLPLDGETLQCKATIFTVPNH